MLGRSAGGKRAGAKCCTVLCRQRKPVNYYPFGYECSFLRRGEGCQGAASGPDLDDTVEVAAAVTTLDPRHRPALLPPVAH
ncbi:hypothetical protein J2W42_000423 [Rhizobium tibeticum]|nr:hypothetical protein [Rhizobium tibeticum]